MLELQFIKKYLGLQEKDHIIREECGEKIKFVVSSDTTVQICPVCGCLTKYVKGYYIQSIKAGNIGSKPIEILLKKRRYVCNDCSKTFTEHYAFVAKHHHIAKNVFVQIMQDLKSAYSMKNIALSNNVSVNTVQRTLNLMPSSHLTHLPEVLSIDEFKGNAGGEKYLLQVSDGKNKKILSVLPTRKKLYISQYFADFPLGEREKVKYLVIDMWRDYADLMIYFPNAKLVIDKFHYKRQIHWAMDRIRKNIQKPLFRKSRVRIKRLRFLLHKEYDELSIEDKLALTTVLEQNEALHNAWHMKERFNDIMQITDREKAVKSFKEWLNQAEALRIEEFNDCIKAYRHWFSGIVESFSVPYTNGFTEGKNNKIKVLKRNAFGFRNFSNFSKRILLIA